MVEKINFNTLNGFGVPGCYMSLETAYKDEEGRVLNVAPLVLVTGAVDSDEWNENHMGVFVEFLKYIQRFLEVGVL